MKYTLPNERVFYGKYKRVKRSKLPANKMLRRTYRQRELLQEEKEEELLNKEEVYFLH